MKGLLKHAQTPLFPSETKKRDTIKLFVLLNFHDLSNLTRKCAKSSNFDRSRSSTYREYTISQLQIHSTISRAQNRQINILYANIKSLTMQKNNQAKDRRIVNTANVHNHGTIFSSYSYKMINK